MDDKPIIISVYNMKGGVGKTTTVFNLGIQLTQFNRRVLLIDFDPNFNLSLYITDRGRYSNNICSLLFNMLNDKECIIDSYIEQSPFGFDFVPSDITLAAIPSNISSDKLIELIKNIISKIQCLAQYDYILIDCPPKLSALQISALTVSTGIIIPVQTQYLSLSSVYDTIDVLDYLEYKPELYGILLTMFEHTDMAIAIEEEILSNDKLKKALFSTKIRKTTLLPESTVFHDIQFDSSYYIEYQRVCDELIDRVEPT